MESYFAEVNGQKILIRIAIVEDNRELRQNLIQVFELLGELHLVFDASDGEEAVQLMNDALVKPEVILMDIEMRKMDGIAATGLIKEKHPDVKILMLTVFESDDNIRKAFAAGADGYLLKDEKPLSMLQLMKDTLEGRLSMSPEVASKTVKILRESGNTEKPSPTDFALTARELEVLGELTQGKNHQAIADELFISPKTVRSHLENIYEKLGVHSKLEASNMAIRNGWVE